MTLVDVASNGLDILPKGFSPEGENEDADEDDEERELGEELGNT